jgi:hypothetical protein
MKAAQILLIFFAMFCAAVTAGAPPFQRENDSECAKAFAVRTV